MSPSRALSSSIDLGGTWQGVRTSFWLLLFIIAHVDGTPWGVCASRVNGRLVSGDSGSGKLDSYQDVFKDAQFFVLKWKAQARVTEMFAEVEHHRQNAVHPHCCVHVHETHSVRMTNGINSRCRPPTVM